MIVHRTGHGEVLDLICFRHYGNTPRATELVLDVNRDLAGKGPILPPGTLILLPRIAGAARDDARTTIKLWD